MDTNTRQRQMLSTRKPTSDLKKLHIETERMEKYILSKWEAKESWSSILISDKIDLKIKKITRGKEGHYIMIKGSIQEEDITIVNIYTPNIVAPRCIR